MRVKVNSKKIVLCKKAMITNPPGLRSNTILIVSIDDILYRIEFYNWTEAEEALDELLEKGYYDASHYHVY